MHLLKDYNTSQLNIRYLFPGILSTFDYQSFGK
jgi:hypothetical protein